MTFNDVKLATIHISDKELIALREAAQFIEKLERALEEHETDTIVRADTQEMIERKELRRVHGILTGFNSSTTYWHMEEE